MERFIAVDSGKYATKVAEYNAKKESIRTFSIRTKVSDGDFRDDAIEEHTVVIKIGDATYKVGNGARGQGVALETDKKTDTHKICVLTALATVASANEVDEMNVSVGMPTLDWAQPGKRDDFKKFILPEGEITVELKKDSNSEVVKKTFKIKNRYVFPESSGAIWQDEVAETLSPTSIIGVLDIGNLNLNATLWQGTEPIIDKSTTADLGGALLIRELSQEISANIVPCNELITANIIKSEERALPAGTNVTDEQRENSRQLIKKVLLEHARKVRRVCNTKDWSLDVMKIVAIGGTAKDIEDELKEVFGNIGILPNPTFCNALGYLRMMCARILNKDINLSLAEKTEPAKKASIPDKVEKKAG
ncbi:MAG: ParM/StbA family protein [Butyrivibrio sp.]|nr:ParM/StbA family protein [Butyrivibrio sp.]